MSSGAAQASAAARMLSFSALEKTLRVALENLGIRCWSSTDDASRAACWAAGVLI
jgi:hypothetical protein